MHMHMHMHTASGQHALSGMHIDSPLYGQPRQCDFLREAGSCLLRLGMGAAGRESSEKGACVDMHPLSPESDTAPRAILHLLTSPF